MEPNVLESIFDGSIQPRDIKLSELQSITDNFSKDRIIGEGGFATVYKGVLLNGNGTVAVKRIRNSHSIDEKLFYREVNSLLMVNHKNIVRFLGFCAHTEQKAFPHDGSSGYILAEDRERILCFEYISNGSLENYIADEFRGLQWDTRYLIIKGICEGLQYLHTEKSIMHMDLKPANILIDNNMVAKITDFGLSRMVDNSQTKTTNIFVSPGYCPPEFIDSRAMSPSYDVYSLGNIIIDLVTGSRSIPDSNNILRRWRHRWQKSGEGTPLKYQQIAKMVKIGLQCQEKDPSNRPSISDIIRVLNELDIKESNVSQIIPYPEDDMLGIEPLDLVFPIKLNNKTSVSLELTNETNAFFAFNIQATRPLSYCIQPNKGIVAPRSKYSVNITFHPVDHAPHDKYTCDFIMRSTKVNESTVSEDTTEDIFNREEGILVDVVCLTSTYKAKVPQVDVSLESLIISDRINLQGTQETLGSPTKQESKLSKSTSDDDVIQFDPPELYFPRVPDKKVLSSVQIINITEFYVCFMLGSPKEDTANYTQEDSVSIIPPRSTKWITVGRKEKEVVVKDMQFNDGICVWYAIVAEGIKGSDLDKEDYNEWKMLPIILTKASPCTSDDLIQFDPPQLSLPFFPNKPLVFSANIVNSTDHYVGFHVFNRKRNVCWFFIHPASGVMPPRSTQRLLVKRIANKEECEDMECKDKFLLWSSIVSEEVQASDFKHYLDYKGSKELPIDYKTTHLCTSKELIQFDPPQLPFFFFLPNMRVSMMCLVKIVNITDHNVGFRIRSPEDNSVVYNLEPHAGILPPQSTQAIMVRRALKEHETEDMQCKDKLFVWNGIVSEGVEVGDVSKYWNDNDKELPIVLTKITSSTLVELIKFEPPEIRFPFLPSKRLSSSIKIFNTTDYPVGFNTHVKETNVALYITEPRCGVLAPWSTQELMLTRLAREEAPELEDMTCKDKYFVWSCFVTEGVNDSDLTSYMPKTERKELPIVFTETVSNDLIQFDPPELCFPLLPNQRVLSSTKIVNITDQYIGFRICAKKSNSASYFANPSQGILPPLSTQVFLVTGVAHEKGLEDTQCKEKFFVWNGIVNEDVKSIDVTDNMTEIKCTELPIVLTKTRSTTSDELIQFDPPKLQFPFLPNKRVLSSFKIVNLTDHIVGFNTYSRPTNVACYHTEPPRGILPPQSTQKLIVTREEKEDALPNDKQLGDKYFVWQSVVSEGVKDSDLCDCVADQYSKELPIVLDKIRSLTSDELIQLEPPELCMPHWPNKKIQFIVNVVNTTDFYVAFNVYTIRRNATRFKESTVNGILPPRATERCILHWIIDDGEPVQDYFVWKRVVTEAVESGDIVGYMVEEESNKLPFIINKVSPCPSNGLIQFDPPELSLPFIPDKQLVFSVNVVNNTDYSLCFNIYRPEKNVSWYYIQAERGVMPPRSTQRLIVKRVPDEKERDDMQCEDKFFLWSSLLSEGVEDSDIFKYTHLEQSKELPVVYKKTSLCTSDELIHFDPPQLPFPFLLNKRVSMLRFFQIVNVTDHIVGFSIWTDEDNSAEYKTEPDAGILPPRSKQKIKVRRTLKENESDDMQCKDKIFVWNGILTEDIEVSDFCTFGWEGDKELPVVLIKPGESSSRLKLLDVKAGEGES